MASLNPVLTEPKVGHGGPRGPEPPQRGYGGDGDRGSSPDSWHSFDNRLRRYRLGLGIGLVSVVMIFVGFTSAMIVRQGVSDDWQSIALPLPMLVVNTLLLIASSFAMERARRAAAAEALLEPVTSLPGVKAERGAHAPWLGVTVGLGLGFLSGQYLAWRQLSAAGVFVNTNPSSSFFYVLTGTHAVHLGGGLLALLYAAVISFSAARAGRRRLVIDIAAWYWHFMGLLWLYIFALLYFAG